MSATKARPPTTADVAALCMLRHTRQAARAITAIYEKASESLGIRATQFTLLVAVVEADGAPFGPIADSLGMDRTTLTREFQTLEREGYLTIGPGKDRRQRCARLTAAGRRMIDRGLPIWAHVQETLERAVSSLRFDELRVALQDVAALEGVAIPEYQR